MYCTQTLTSVDFTGRDLVEGVDWYVDGERKSLAHHLVKSEDLPQYTASKMAIDEVKGKEEFKARKSLGETSSNIVDASLWTIWKDHKTT